MTARQRLVLASGNLGKLRELSELLAPMTLEQFDAEIALKLLDRLGDRRLRDRQVLGGARHRALLGDGDEEL